jgi:hypothetical protein
MFHTRSTPRSVAAPTRSVASAAVFATQAAEEVAR